MKSTSRKNYTQSTLPKSSIYLSPIIFIVAILPFIIRFHTYDPKLSNFLWFGNITNFTDVFLYFKQLLFIITISIMLIAIIYKYLKNNRILKLPFILYPMFAYGILALLSTIFSEHPSYGFSGSFEQFESIFVLIGYVLILIYVAIFINKESDLQKINHYFLVSILTFGVLGLSQAVGHDLLRTDLLKKLYIQRAGWSNLDSITFNFPPKTAYLTLYNPNYVGVYTALVIPILLCLLITEKNIKYRIAYIVALITMSITLISSGSAAGLISTFISIVVAIVVLRKQLLKYKKIALSIFFTLLTALLVLCIIRFDTIKAAINTKLSFTKTSYDITDIKTEDNLTITYKNNIININYNYDDSEFILFLQDSDKKDIPFEMQDATGQYTILDERFSGLIITPASYNNILCINIDIDGKSWVFTNQTSDGTFYYLNSKGNFDKMVKADSALLTGYENIASGRGYIWSRSIPLIKDNIILGSGADSFVFEFPQNDYLNYYYSGFEGQTLTKPHSLYLQTSIQTGLLSLIAILVFYIMYFISSIRLYINCNFNTYWEKIGAAYFIGTLSYMIASITNDSTITVAPIFWTIAGIGVAINYKLTRNEVNFIKSK